jgi:hypothetical protein
LFYQKEKKLILAVLSRKERALRIEIQKALDYVYSIA